MPEYDTDKILLPLLAQVSTTEAHVPTEDVSRAHLERDLGIDSLALTELVTALEGALGIVIPDEATGRLDTVDDVRRCLQRLTAAATTIPAPEGPEQ